MHANLSLVLLRCCTKFRLQRLPYILFVLYHISQYVYFIIILDAEKADSAHGLMEEEEPEQKEVVFNTLNQGQTSEKTSGGYVAPTAVAAPAPASCTYEYMYLCVRVSSIFAMET